MKTMAKIQSQMKSFMFSMRSSPKHENNGKDTITDEALYVEWADKEGLHAAQNIIFSMHNHGIQVTKVKIGFNSL